MHTTLGETPPVAPGESPFHMKGMAFLGHLAWVDEHFPGGRRAFLTLLTPPMQAFFSQTFLAIGFYDFLPLVSAGHVCARVLAMRFADFIEMRARHQAKLDVGGVYRVLLALTSPKMLAGRLPRMMSKYFDFGEVKLLSQEPYAVTFEAATVPAMTVDWFLACYTGYVEVVLGAAGGKLPTIDIERQPADALRGYPACRMVGTVRWS